MSKQKKTIRVTMTRIYSKFVEVDIEVDANLEGDALYDYLTENNEVQGQLDSRIEETSLQDDDGSNTYYDIVNKVFIDGE